MHIVSMARRGTPLAKKVARPTRFDERLLVRACTPRIIPRLAGYSQRILSSRVTARSDRGRGDRFIRYYSDIVAVKRGAVSLLCAVIQIELSIIRYKEEDSLAGSIGGGNKRKQEISVRQLDRAILSLPAQIFSDSISTYSGNPATCYFDPLLDLFARIYSFPPSP